MIHEINSKRFVYTFVQDCQLYTTYYIRIIHARRNLLWMYILNIKIIRVRNRRRYVMEKRKHVRDLAPFASSEDLSDERESPLDEDKQKPKLSNIEEEVMKTPPKTKTLNVANITPRIDISRASSSSHQEDSSPERELYLGKKICNLSVIFIITKKVICVKIMNSRMLMLSYILYTINANIFQFKITIILTPNIGAICVIELLWLLEFSSSNFK